MNRVRLVCWSPRHLAVSARWARRTLGRETILGGAIFFTVVALLSGERVWGQAPTIKVVIPFPAGGSADALTRLSADHLGHAGKATMVIENRPGAGTVTATEAVSRAAPDGTTLLINANSFVINPHLRNLSYDPLTSFEPICHLVSSPQVLVVNRASPYRTLADLIGAARAKPGELNIASLGPATAQHIAVEKLKRAAGVNMTFLPYPGNMPAVTALLGGHVTSVLANYAEVAEQLRAGTLRALATASKSRIDLLPDVPTIAEQGYPDYESTVWIGVVAPAKTPRDIIARLSGWFMEAISAPDVKPKLAALGLFPVLQCGEAFGAHLRAQFEDYGRQIREANIKGQ